jgi:hypothetical protein
MTTARCATCVHWRDSQKHHRGPRDLAVLGPDYRPVTPQPFELHECLSPKVRFYERPEVDGVALMDGSEFFATMVTGPDFGCIHHEPDPRP